ncbi:14029_t:CDS:2 [Funneliformis mosseae]|uniref:14029_t:CDS:1 n=1 Tax=Funneliformis mosseae TaxID=27381 RepID=A0A9N9AU84_FUNMO|nr:14029_t:CDS:2 [Funneliformis mosseae]
MPRQIKKRSKTIESRKVDPLVNDIIQAPPEIKLPWPPAVTAEDFVRNRPKTKIDIKSPNSFFVYRAAFVKQLLIEQHKFKMTQVSKWASSSWKNESKEVKETYKVMAQKIDKEFQEKRKAIKGYRIVCENYGQKSIEEDPQEQNDNPIPDLITWQPPNYPEYFPYIINMTPVASPGSTSSDTYESDNTINNSPISPRSTDFSFYENHFNFNNNTDRVYLPTSTSFTGNFCASIFTDVVDHDNSDDSQTNIEESEYYNPAVCIVSETPGCFIEDHYNDYLSWN